MSTIGMLDDIKILDFSHVYFGPYTTLILADMGADVIKIEPPWGEVARLYPPLFGGMSSVFLYINRNKRGMTLNLKESKAKEIALALAEKCDVVVENFKRGTMEKLGLGYEDIKKVRPDTIYASLSGFGLDGPYKNRTSFAPIAGSIAGWYRLNGDLIDPEGPPIRPAEWHGDLDPGLFGAVAILGAIRHHDKTGEGQLIDISQLDSMIAQTGVSITRYTMSGELPWQARKKYMGLDTFGMFKASDGYVYIAADPYMVPRLIKGMGVEKLEKTEELEEWCSTRNIKDIVEALVEQSVPAAPVNQIDHTLEDPHVKARGIIIETDHPTAGKVRSPGFPVKMSRTPAKYRLPAPQLGEHNQEILRDLLGYSEEQITDLKKTGILG
ncbi:MAG: CoA transferase [Candidatus Bathyarchaeota archaeon]|jgi:crotonobetainyl-CoA:carnitine CoA-transferase CaiB-like acyl-CoA transferase